MQSLQPLQVFLGSFPIQPRTRDFLENGCSACSDCSLDLTYDISTADWSLTVLITPRTRAAHRTLGDAVEALLNVVLEHAPRAAALTFVAECLESLAEEHREWAATCADSEAREEADLMRWWSGR